jgi:hypothetical protein
MGENLTFQLVIDMVSTTLAEYNAKDHLNFPFSNNILTADVT